MMKSILKSIINLKSQFEKKLLHDDRTMNERTPCKSDWTVVEINEYLQ